MQINTSLSAFPTVLTFYETKALLIAVQGYT